jgi:uncharacterized Zn-binding protein involved in type VI secretion
MTLYGEDGRGVIRLGDSTDHGGEVISVSRTFTDMGKPVACVGDMVQCPKCRGTFPIAQGDSNKTHMGLPIAFHGDKTTCGATLISSWGIKGVSSIARGSAGIAPTENRDNTPHSFDEMVHLNHEMPDGIPYYIELLDGTTSLGHAGSTGRLPRIPTELSQDYKVFWGDEALAKIDKES